MSAGGREIRSSRHAGGVGWWPNEPRAAQAQREQAKIVNVARPGRECLHGKDVIR
jgi:hypothetical protein